MPNYTPRIGNPKYVNQGMETTQPVLGNQPPLLGVDAVRYLQPKDMGHDGDLVPISYYGEEITHARNPLSFYNSS